MKYCNIIKYKKLFNKFDNFQIILYSYMYGTEIFRWCKGKKVMDNLC